MTELVACVGCGGHVADVDGPTHRYIGASPGCWALYTTIMAGGVAGGVPDQFEAMGVDAYAVQHPGVPGPQSTPSVWVHLIALHLALAGGWPADRLIWIRQMAADAFDRWPWLEPPAAMGSVTIADVAAAGDTGIVDVRRRWVEGAWSAWDAHHDAVRERAAWLLARLG